MGVVAANDPGGRREAQPRAQAHQGSPAWSIPEIRLYKDDQGRLRIDQSDPATYGAYAARQLLATAEADQRYREGMTKRPSSPSIMVTYVNGAGAAGKFSVREIFCRMEGDALVVTKFETAEGETVKELPIAAAPAVEDVEDVDDLARLHELALAELGEGLVTKGADDPDPPVQAEPERPRRMPTGPLRQYDQPADQQPLRERRMPTGPLRQYDDAGNSAPGTGKPAAAASSERAAGGLAVPPSAPKPATVTANAPPQPPVRSLNESEAAAFRSLIEARAAETRWASSLLLQTAERFPTNRKQQNEHLGNLLRVSFEPSRAESQTPLAAALRGIIEEVLAYKPTVLDRDPLKAEKLALQPFARTVLQTPSPADTPVKTVSGTAQRTPAQVLAKLEDPKLARATRIRYLLEIVPELIENWRPDKESGHSDAANESSPAIVRRLFAVANEQRQQRKYIDDGADFKKAVERYKVLERKLPKFQQDDDT